jgi:hypothetical protein
MGNLQAHPTEDKTIVLLKNSTEQIHLAVRQYEGREYADLRLFFKDDAGEWKPTRKGLSVSPRLWPAFREGLAELESELRARGLLAEEGT